MNGSYNKKNVFLTRGDCYNTGKLYSQFAFCVTLIIRVTFVWLKKSKNWENAKGPICFFIH